MCWPDFERFAQSYFAVQTTLTKHGNSYALVIDKPILDLLKIRPDTPLEIATDGKKLLISPTSEDGESSGVK